MFCGKCGAKIEDGATFCHSCGNEVCSTNSDRIVGKLLVSTKASSGRKIAVAVSSVFLIVVAFFILFHFDQLGKVGEDIFGNSTIGIIIGIVVMGCLFVYPIVSAIGFNFYCNVYENAVSEITGLSLSNPKAAMEKFSLTYDKITNVTEAGKTIFIYTNCAKYEVLAMTNRAEAVREITVRLSR